MPGAHFYTAATEIETGDWIAAGVTVVVAIVIAQLLDRVLARRGRH